MVLAKSLILFTCCLCSLGSAESSLHSKKDREYVKYSKHDILEDWKPNKLDGIQDRFHPVTLHHVKVGPGKLNQPNQLINPPPANQNIQPLVIQPNQQSFDGGFRSELPQQQFFQLEEPESHAGEVNPNLVSPVSFQSLDFPVHNQNNYIAYVQTTPTPPVTTAATVNDSVKTVYVPWIYIPPGRGSRNEIEPYKIEKPPEPSYLPPKPSYLPPEPHYLPPGPAYLPPEPTYLPPPPPPTYLPPEPSPGYSYPPPRTYLPPEPRPGYSYPPPPLPFIPDEKEKAAEFTYFFLGRKLWYIPLYFSIYFVLYVGYLVLKAIARHKLKFPQLLHNAAVVTARDLIQMGLFTSRDFNDMEELVLATSRAIQRGN